MNRFRALSSAVILAGATLGLAVAPASAATKAKPTTEKTAKHVKKAKDTKKPATKG